MPSKPKPNPKAPDRGLSHNPGLTFVGTDSSIPAIYADRITPAVRALTPGCLEWLREQWNDGKDTKSTLRDFLNEFPGKSLTKRDLDQVFCVFRAESIDIFRSRLPAFKDDLERCDYHLDEVAEVARIASSKDMELYLKYSAELRKWMLLKNQLINPIVNNNLTVNFNQSQETTSAKDELRDKIASILAKSASNITPSTVDSEPSNPEDSSSDSE